MKKIIDIYEEYEIMPILQIHHFRVASVAFMICDNLEINVDKNIIIKACLLHDIANIIKSDLNYFPEINEFKSLDYWQSVKDKYIEKYGNNEHKASVEITRNLGLNDSIVHLVDIIDHCFVEGVAKSLDFAEKICIYADNRVSPHHIVSIEERSLEAKKRYENHPHVFNDEERGFFMKNIREIENQIFSKCKIKPEDINDQSIEPYLKKLKDFTILE